VIVPDVFLIKHHFVMNALEANPVERMAVVSPKTHDSSVSASTTDGIRTGDLIADLMGVFYLTHTHSMKSSTPFSTSSNSWA
jgi:hypothetical protein